MKTEENGGIGERTLTDCSQEMVHFSLTASLPTPTIVLAEYLPLAKENLPGMLFDEEGKKEET